MLMMRKINIHVNFLQKRKNWKIHLYVSKVHALLHPSTSIS